MDLQNNNPIQSSQNIWTIIISIVATALIVGGGLFFWQKFQTDVLRQEIQALNNQIEYIAAQNKKLALDLNESKKLSIQNNLLNQNVNQLSDVIKYSSKYGFSLEYPKKYETDDNYGIWTAKNESIGLLDEWGVNYYQETVIAISVYKKGSSVAQGLNQKILEKGDYIYVINTSFSDLYPQEHAYQEYSLIFKSLEI